MESTAPALRAAEPTRIRRPLRRRILWTTAVPLVLALGFSLLAIQNRLERYLGEQAGADLDSAISAFESRLATGNQDLALWAKIAATTPQVRALLVRGEAGEDLSKIAGITAEEIRRTARISFFQLFDQDGAMIASSSDPAAPPLPQLFAVAAAPSEPQRGNVVAEGSLFQIANESVISDGAVRGSVRCGVYAPTSIDAANFTGVTIALGEAPPADGSGEERGRRIRPIPDLISPRPAAIVFTRSLEAGEALIAGVRSQLLTIGLLTVLLALGLANWLAERITRPLEQLVSASTQLAQGNYETPVRCDTDDELAALATSFDSMRGSLHQQIRLINDLDQMKSDFLGLASHELRTPASILQGCTDLLADNPPPELAPGGSQHELLLALQRASRDLIRVVEQVTDMTLLDRRQITLGLAPLDLGEVVWQAGRRHSEEVARRHLDLDLEIEPGALHVLASKDRISQALDHVVHNAIRFTPDGGRIVLRARADNSEVICEVQDTGIGIPPEVQERIFDPLFEGKPLNHHRSGTLEFGSSGLGMGLAICQRIVKAHRGRIEVESSPGRGSTFRIGLPRLVRFEARLLETASHDLRSAPRDSASEADIATDSARRAA